MDSSSATPLHMKHCEVGQPEEEPCGIGMSQPAYEEVGPSQPEVMVVNCSSGHIDGRQETGPYKPDELVY